MGTLTKTGINLADTQKLTISLWARVHTADFAAQVGSALPLMEWGFSEDSEFQYFWTQVNETAAFEAHPEQFGGAVAPAPAIPTPDTCSFHIEPRGTFGPSAVLNYNGAKELRDSDITTPVEFGEYQFHMANNEPSAGPNPQDQLIATYTSHWWLPALGNNPDFPFQPICEGGVAGASVGHWFAGQKYWRSFRVNGPSRFPCGIYVNKTTKQLSVWVLSVLTDFFDDGFPYYVDEVARSISGAFVADQWNHIFVSMDMTGVTSGTFTTDIVINGVDRFSSVSFFDENGKQFTMGLDGLEIGLPKIPSDMSRNSGSGLNQPVRYGHVQAWFNQYIEATPTNLSKFISTSGGTSHPANPALAAEEFGPPDLKFLGGESNFINNQGSAGAFTKVGTIRNYTPTPSF